MQEYNKELTVLLFVNHNDFKVFSNLNLKFQLMHIYSSNKTVYL